MSVELALTWVGLAIALVTCVPAYREYRRMYFDWRLERENKKVAGEIARTIAPTLDASSLSQVESYSIKKYWRSAQEQSLITSIVSGKGGVGKSLLALGLAAYHSDESKAILVDFDLHNRGLSSKLRSRITPSTTTVFALLERFRSNVSPVLRDLLRDENGALDLRRLTLDKFVELRDLFCYENLATKELISFNVVKLEASAGKSSRQVLFLPSRDLSQPFLASEISRLDIPEVAVFVKFLASLAAKSTRSERMILDCHGAHDLFMAGAIVASEELAIVSRADVSAFEGTVELVALAKRLVESASCAPRSEVLVFSELRDREAEIEKELLRAMKYSEARAVSVPQDESVLTAYHKMSIPALRSIGSFWASIQAIVSTLGGRSSVEEPSKDAEAPEQEREQVEAERKPKAVLTDAPGSPAHLMVKRVE